MKILLCNKRTLILVLFSMYLLNINCFAGDWKKISGPYQYINFITYNPQDTNSIIVGSNDFTTDLSKSTITFYNFDGLGYKVSKDKGETFVDSSLAGYSVFNIIQDADSSAKWYASVRKSTRGGIVVSSDNGTSWTTYPMSCDGSYQILDMISTKNPEKYFCAAVNTAAGLISTDNDFETCTTDNDVKVSSRSIKQSGADSNILFIAGDASLGDWGIFWSTDKGVSWEKRDSFGLNKLRILCVQPSSEYPGTIYCGADSLTINGTSVGKGLYQSLDTGKTWNLIAAKGYRVYQIAQHPLYSKYMAAACDSLGVLVSACWGYGWENRSNGLPTDSSVRLVTIPPWDSTTNGIVIFASVFGDGLYKSSYIKSSVFDKDNDNNFEISAIYPNPVREALTINWNNKAYSQVEIYISNLYGEKIAQLESGNFTEGSHTSIWKPKSDLQQGIYNIVIKSGTNYLTDKVVYIK